MGHPLTRALLAAVLGVGLIAGCGGGGRATAKLHKHFAGPTRMALQPNFLDPYGHYLFVINNQGGTITVVNAQKYTVLSSHTEDVNDTDVVRVGRAPYDLAMTPAGDRLYVTDTWEDRVRMVSGWAGRRPDVWDVANAFDEQGREYLKYDIKTTELDLMVRAGELAIQSELPDEDDGLFVYITDPDNQRIVVLDAATDTEANEIPLPAEPARIAISSDGDRLFISTATGELLFADARTGDLLPDDTLTLGGHAGTDGDFAGRRRTLRGQRGTAVLAGRAADGSTVPDRRRRAAPRLAQRIVAHEKRPPRVRRGGRRFRLRVRYENAPHLQFGGGARLFLRRVAALESGPGTDRRERLPRPDRAVGDHLPRRKRRMDRARNQFRPAARAREKRSVLRHGRRRARLFIRENEFHASDGDTFYFETDVGIPPLRVGLVPDAVVATPYYLNPRFDVVFVANSGSHNLSILFSEEQQRLGIIN
ncbi:MAG: hypothetical protein M5R36_15875 [Deltaproteobacteria bacterium]|nr:hypothetical protein [Deltaproteobacteria bacterium]